MKISVTKLKQFKACRKSYEFKYVEGLEPVKKAEVLETGENYHKKLELLYRTGELDTSDFSKESAMATAYKKYIYPHFHMNVVEEWLEKDFGEHTLIGRIDGMTDDGTLVEHKSTSMDIGAEYEYNLQWDEQILAYMLLSNTRKIYYTVCKKPTIRLKKDETEEQFFNRMVEWYDSETESKIRLIEIYRTDKEVFDFASDLSSVIAEMEGCNNFYRNTLHCFRFGRQCEYASICLNYDPSQSYIEFEKREESKNAITQIG